MAGTNDFLPFATGVGANVLTPTAYAALTTLLANGFSAGLAESQQLNTVWRQSAFISSVVAKMVADLTNQNVVDNGVVNTFERQLLLALGLTNVGVDSGAANAYAVTFTDTLAANALVDGLRVHFRATNANTGASTLNWNGTGAKAIQTSALAALVGGEIADDTDITVVYNPAAAAGAGAWILEPFAKLTALQSWIAKQTFSTTIKAQQALEKITITAAAPTATQNFDWLTQALQYFTTNGANNWTLNVRGDASNSLNSLMAIGESATISVWATMGATPYYSNAMTIDGTAVTPKWIGGAAPVAGDASCINVYTYTIVKTADATFTVIASKARTS